MHVYNLELKMLMMNLLKNYLTIKIMYKENELPQKFL